MSPYKRVIVAGLLVLFTGTLQAKICVLTYIQANDKSNCNYSCDGKTSLNIAVAKELSTAHQMSGAIATVMSNESVSLLNCSHSVTTTSPSLVQPEIATLASVVCTLQD